MTEPGVLRAVRLGALAVGSAALLYAMLLARDDPRPRDLAWTIGVAALVLSLVANRLLRRTGPETPPRVDENEDSR